MRRSSVVRLVFGFGIAFGMVGSAKPPMPPGFFSAYNWRSGDPAFGGFSAIDVTEDGSGFIAVSDRGLITSGQFVRDEAQKIVAVKAGPVQHLRSETNHTFPEDWNDSEGLAVLSDGSFYVSFERNARILRYPSAEQLPTVLPGHPDFPTLNRNSSLEALAVDAQGAIYTLPEETDSLTTPFSVYRFQNNVWDQPFSLPRRGWFLASGADIGPDGKFYLLERQFRGLSGFASRVRRFSIGPNGVSDEETLFQSKVGQHDNLEGLAVWRDASGAIRLTMISDNNYFFLQRTEIIEYRIPD